MYYCYIIMIITIINWYQSGRLLKSSKYACTTSELNGDGRKKNVKNPARIALPLLPDERRMTYSID